MLHRIIRLYYRLYYKYWIDHRVNVCSGSFIHNAATFIVADNPQAKIVIKENVYIGRYANIHTNSEVTVGNNSVLSDYVYISTLSHSFEPEQGPIMLQPSYDKGHVILGENVFLGFGSKVMPNVTLGDWCIVGAGAVVTKSFPSYTMVAGNPARIIKIYDKKAKAWVLYDSPSKKSD